MKRLFIIISTVLSLSAFAQMPSVSAPSFSLDNYGLYNNWHSQTDTFFVVPIRMDSFVSGVDSFAFNLLYDGALLSPILDLSSINNPSFILLMNYLGGAEFAMVDGGTIHADTFDMGMSNTNKLLSISFQGQSAFTQGIYNNCWGTLLYVAFKRKNLCDGGTFSLNFTNGMVGTSYVNPNQPNTFLLSGTQNYSADNGTLIANDGQISKQAFEVSIAQNGLVLEATVNYGMPPFTFLWNSGEITQNINPANWGNTYYVFAEDAFGCIDSSNTLIALGESTIPNKKSKKLISILDLQGRKVNTNNQPLLYKYDDGTIEKKIILK